MIIDTSKTLLCFERFREFFGNVLHVFNITEQAVLVLRRKRVICESLYVSYTLDGPVLTMVSITNRLKLFHFDMINSTCCRLKRLCLFGFWSESLFHHQASSSIWRWMTLHHHLALLWVPHRRHKATRTITKLGQIVFQKV